MSSVNYSPLQQTLLTFYQSRVLTDKEAKPLDYLTKEEQQVFNKLGTLNEEQQQLVHQCFAAFYDFYNDSDSTDLARMRLSHIITLLTKDYLNQNLGKHSNVFCVFFNIFEGDSVDHLKNEERIPIVVAMNSNRNHNTTTYTPWVYPGPNNQLEIEASMALIDSSWATHVLLPAETCSKEQKQELTLAIVPHGLIDGSKQ